MSQVNSSFRLLSANAVGSGYAAPMPQPPVARPATRDAALLTQVRPQSVTTQSPEIQKEMAAMQAQIMKLQGDINILMRMIPTAPNGQPLPRNCCLCCPSGCLCPCCAVPNPAMANARPMVCLPGDPNCAPGALRVCLPGDPNCPPGAVRVCLPGDPNCPPGALRVCLPGDPNCPPGSLEICKPGDPGCDPVTGLRVKPYPVPPTPLQTNASQPWSANICLPGDPNCAPSSLKVCLPGDPNCAPGSVRVCLPGDPNCPDGSLEICVPGDPGCDARTGLRIKNGNQPTQLQTQRYFPSNLLKN